jgi:hypothetical protein
LSEKIIFLQKSKLSFATLKIITKFAAVSPLKKGEAFFFMALSRLFMPL